MFLHVGSLWSKCVLYTVNELKIQCKQVIITIILLSLLYHNDKAMLTLAIKACYILSTHKSNLVWPKNNILDILQTFLFKCFVTRNNQNRTIYFCSLYRLFFLDIEECLHSTTTIIVKLSNNNGFWMQFIQNLKFVISSK